MKSETFLLVLSIIVIFFSVISISMSFNNLNLMQKLTGYSTSYGYVNLTILTYVSINLTVDSISWGEGNINAGEVNATLYTVGDEVGVVQRGNWSGVNASAFVVENTGNLNCSISIQSGKNAHDFFNSGTNSNEQYMLNVSNKEAGSCIGSSLGSWVDVNKTSGGTKFCNNFNFRQGVDEIYIDVLLTVPADAGNLDEQSDVIIVTADAAG